jgi:hypothetical protein
MAPQAFVGPWALLLQFRNLFYAVGSTPWTGDQPVARPQATQRTTQTQNKYTQTSMPWVGLESTIPAFERAKTVHALNRARRHCESRQLDNGGVKLWLRLH